MSEPKYNTIALNVRLKPVDYSNLPHQANYSNVGMAQGIAYLDFGFIEPRCWGDRQDGERWPGRAEGHRWPACHPRGHGCGCAREIASTDPASVGWVTGCAAAEAKKLSPGEVLSGRRTRTRSEMAETKLREQ